MKLAIPLCMRVLGAALAAVVLSAASCFAWPYSGESNPFDLSPTPANIANGYFSGESGVFSLAGVEGTYAFTVSANYSSTLSQVRILTYVYDIGHGAVVSSGSGSYRIVQGGVTIRSGSLTYSSASRWWDSGAISLSTVGAYDVLVVVNGQSASSTFSINATPPVHLIGSARTDAGVGIGGATVKLYGASTVLSAANLNSLPAPLASGTTQGNGSFDFGNVAVGQYILVLLTGSGTTIAPAFWLRSGETTHSEVIVENPGRTELLNDLALLRDLTHARVVDKQTAWMMTVADTVDGDLDTNPELVDWCLFLAGFISGSAANIAIASAASQTALSASQVGDVLTGVTAKTLAVQDAKLALALTTIGTENLASIGSMSRAGQAALTQPYFAYGANASQELSEIRLALGPDVESLLDPRLTKPFPLMVFNRDAAIRRHNSMDWWEALGSYQFAERWLASYYNEAVIQMPALTGTFSMQRADLILRASFGQLDALGTGSGLLFIGPDASECSSAGGIEPLGLNLYDYYMKYEFGRAKKEAWKDIGRGSSIVASGAHCVAAASALGVVTAPGAAAAEAVALTATAVNLGASVAQAEIKTDMTATYAQMSAKYAANLVTAPLALKRTADFMASEAAHPYYLNVTNQFGGNLGDASLGGTIILGQEVFFPLQLSLLPFVPPIQLTDVKTATLNVTNPVGAYASAGFRVETKVCDFSGAHNHVVISAGQLSAGQKRQVQVPFRGHMTANGILSRGVFETRLWAGPFQKSIKTKDFIVVPINIGFPQAPLSLESVQNEMRKPLGNVKMNEKSLTGDQVVDLSDRVRERVEVGLVVGTNVFERTYTFSNSVFETEIRLYRPAAAKISFSARKDGEYIGWDSITSEAHYGFPGSYSGQDWNPEWIRIPNCGGQTITVHVELAAVSSEPVNVLLEVWEKPIRDAVVVALPDSVSMASRTGGVHSIELAVGESSQQQPLLGLTISLSSLAAAGGKTTLPWTNTTFTGTTNLAAGSIRFYNLEINTSNAVSGTYTGAVTIVATNAGTILVPVSVTVDGVPPTVLLTPFKEWWHASTGPNVTWSGQDNVTAPSALAFSVWLEGWETNWSGFSAVTNRDLTGMPDGHYTLHIVARDQALNESSDCTASIYIDRAGNLWRQRIVDASGGAFTNVSQVLWTDDFDHDGASNLQEYLAGTDPTNPNDRFAIAAVVPGGDGVHVRWYGKRGFRYQVLRTSDLSTGVWVQASSGTTAIQKSQQLASADGVLEYVDMSPRASRVFYRVVIVVDLPTLLAVRSGSNLLISWSSSFTGFTLEQNPNLVNPTGWSGVGLPVADDGTNQIVTITAPAGIKFYRLRR